MRGASFLEPFFQCHIPGSPLDIGRRLVVADVNSAGYERRLRIEYVVHAERYGCIVNPRAPATRTVFRGRDRHDVLVFPDRTLLRERCGTLLNKRRFISWFV